MDKETEFSNMVVDVLEESEVRSGDLICRAYSATMTEAKKAEVNQEKIFSEVLNESQARLRGLPVKKDIRTRYLTFTVHMFQDGTTAIHNNSINIDIQESTLNKAFTRLGNVLKRKKEKELREGLE